MSRNWFSREYERDESVSGVGYRYSIPYRAIIAFLSVAAMSREDISAKAMNARLDR